MARYYTQDELLETIQEVDSIPDWDDEKFATAVYQPKLNRSQYWAQNNSPVLTIPKKTPTLFDYIASIKKGA